MPDAVPSERRRPGTGDLTGDDLAESNLFERCGQAGVLYVAPGGTAASGVCYKGELTHTTPKRRGEQRAKRVKALEQAVRAKQQSPKVPPAQRTTSSLGTLTAAMIWLSAMVATVDSCPGCTAWPKRASCTLASPLSAPSSRAQRFRQPSALPPASAL